MGVRPRLYKAWLTNLNADPGLPRILISGLILQLFGEFVLLVLLFWVEITLNYIKHTQYKAFFSTFSTLRTQTYCGLSLASPEKIIKCSYFSEETSYSLKYLCVCRPYINQLSNNPSEIQANVRNYNLFLSCLNSVSASYKFAVLSHWSDNCIAVLKGKLFVVICFLDLVIIVCMLNICNSVSESVMLVRL